jgi:hypothetical protein
MTGVVGRALSSWHAISELRHNLSSPQRPPTAIPWGLVRRFFVNLTTPGLAIVSVSPSTSTLCPPSRSASVVHPALPAVAAIRGIDQCDQRRSVCGNLRSVSPPASLDFYRFSCGRKVAQVAPEETGSQRIGRQRLSASIITIAYYYRAA